MSSDDFVPADFDPPTSLVADGFRLEPLGPQHNESDHAAWTSSIEHIRSTSGYPDGRWPPVGGMTLEENLVDLRRHADDWDITVQSWVRADRAELDVPVADAVARWLATDWPWKRIDRCGR